MKKLHKTLVIVAIILLSVSCKDKKIANRTDNLFKFKEYISYTTSGVVSVATPIYVELAKPSKIFENEAAETILKGIAFSPSIKGKIQKVSNTKIAFIPSEKLKPNTEYTVKVNLKKWIGKVPSDYKKYQFKFKTIQQNFKVSTSAIQSISKKYQYIQGNIETADVANFKKLKQVISASQKNKELAVKWEKADSLTTKFYFKVDSVQRFEDDSKVLLKWDGKHIGVDNKDENTITIIGKNNFKVVKVEVLQTPEQQLHINFSDPLKKQQNFKGLVAIQNTKNLKYVVDGNILKVYPSSRIVGNVLVDVFQGIKSTDGYKLKTPYSSKVSFEQLKPAVKLISNGVILPTSDNLKFNFKAVNLKAVDVRIIKIFESNILQFLQNNNLGNTDRYSIRRVGRRIAKKTITLVKSPLENTGKWKAYALDVSKLIKTDPGAIYRIELSIKPEYSLYKCDASNAANTEDVEEYYEEEFEYNEQDYTTQEAKDAEEREEQYWDNLIYSYQNNYYSWRDRDNPCKKAYYLNDRRIVSANILASNLGVIVKKGDNKSYFFAVTNIINTKPVKAAKVTLYNYQQQEIASTTTNNEGFAIIDSNKNAYFAIVSHQNNKTYIKLDDGRSLSLSKFNISGKKSQKGLKGFIYGDRGVWRPGDSLFLTFVLNSKANPLPKNHPVKLEVTNARGKMVYKRVVNSGINDFYKFIVPTSANAPTGNWNAVVTVGGAKFYKGLKVETVKPNRFKIKLNFNDKILTSKKTTKGTIQVNWLHGATAKNIKVEVSTKLTANTRAFSGQFPKYKFTDPTKQFSLEEMPNITIKTNAEGNAVLANKFNLKSKAPGMLKAHFLTKAYEKGGDFSMDVLTKDFAPYASFVGVRPPKPNRYGSYETGKNYNFETVVVNAEGKPQASKKLEIQVYKLEWRWWWNSSSDNLSSYGGTTYRKPFKTINKETKSNGKINFNLSIPKEEGGRYLVRIINTSSGHATGFVTYFYKDWYKRPSTNPEAAKMLLFSADKEKYKTGETANITFPSSANSRALISIENGVEVIDSFWKETTQGETTVQIPITNLMAPNVFVHISLLQPHATTLNNLPLRLYGVIPLMVENPASKLQPVVVMPKEIKPEQEFTVKVSEKQGKRMTYTVAIVEEGLLDLTRYKTPDIWNSFYAKQALGVKTWDIFDEVIGAFGGSIEQVFAIGGDGNAVAGKNKKANRFKPVVKYLGPFVLTKGSTDTHRIKMPKYIGSVRTMIVAGDNSKEAYGKAEVTTPVKKPLMVLTSLPRKLSPSEKVTLPVTVFAMDKKVKKATVTLKLSEGIKAVGLQSKVVSFAKPEDKMVYFDLDVSNAKGIATIEAIAKGGGEKSSYKVEIDVENPNPVTTKKYAIELTAKETKAIDFTTFGVNGSNFSEIEFSTLPPMDISDRLGYLIRYPHGCVEQTTSAVFPQLFLDDVLELSAQKKQEIQNNIEKGIHRLGQFQLTNGGVSYWLGQNYANDWGTSYVGHFMIEAEKKGYQLPISFISNWLRYQKEQTRNWRPNKNDLSQAYRLYTLALAGNPDLSAMNRLREYREISNNAKWRLAAAYALVGQKEVAKKLANTANINFKNNYYYYTYGSVDRNRAMAMETMLILKDKSYLGLAKLIANSLSSKKWMSTQTTAYSLLAMSKMIKSNGGKPINVSYALNNQTFKKVKSNYALVTKTLQEKAGNNTVSIKNNIDNTVFVTLTSGGILPVGQELVEQRGLSITTNYKDAKGNKIQIEKLPQGTEFFVEVTISNLKPERVKNIALTQIFPSGWEIVNTRFTNFGNTVQAKADYTDIRDASVNFYFDLSKNESKTFRVQLNASYLGNYYLYGVQAEAMYDNAYFVRTKGKWVQVVN